MIGTQDISSRFALDVQSVDKLRLQAKQDPDAALKAVAQQFEGIFVNMMLKSMREATPKDGMLDSEQGNLYTQLFDQQLAQKLSTGKGLGVADMIVKQLTLKNSPENKTSPESPVPSPEHGLNSVLGAQGSARSTQLPSLSIPDQALRTGDSGLGAVDSALSTQDSVPAFKNPRGFVNELWPHAAEVGKDMGVPPRFLIGQAALESGWGKRQIHAADGKNSHNLFGIKAGGGWTGEVVETTTTEYRNGAPQKKTELFRAYASYAESFRDYSRLLQNSPRYKAVLQQGQDAAGFAQALQGSGYATDPLYADKLTRVLNSQVLREALRG
ncbi:MAG: flagellar assembly peptidoglycan hydrolase FlgJ [Sulfuricella sp.]|nr:flagellar assembly peptidoglycan hydrolase FlgJ [Sulfuricella sp.]